MASVFLSPHSDDETLFGSFVIQRERPIVIVISDGTSHEKKFGIPVHQRRLESGRAMHVFGLGVIFLGVPEEEMTVERIAREIGGWWDKDRAYVPAMQGGNPHHDMVCEAAQKVFNDRCLFYSTYTKDSLEPQGELELKPTELERKLKEQALQCYESQIKINPHHFEAVRGKSEFLNLHA